MRTRGRVVELAQWYLFVAHLQDPGSNHAGALCGLGIDQFPPDCVGLPEISSTSLTCGKLPQLGKSCFEEEIEYGEQGYTTSNNLKMYPLILS